MKKLFSDDFDIIYTRLWICREKDGVVIANKLFLMLIVIISAALTGCATPSPPDHEANRRAKASTLIAAKDYRGAFDAIKIDLYDAGISADQTADFILKAPDFRNTIASSITVELHSTNTAWGIYRLAKGVAGNGVSRVLNEDEKRGLTAEIEKTAASGNLTNRLPWLITDSTESFKSLSTPEHRAIIFRRSLESLKANPKITHGNRHLAEKLFLTAQTSGNNSEEYKLLQAMLPSLNLPTDILRDKVVVVYPEYAAKILAQRELVVRINFDDRLLEEDVVGGLRRASPNLTFVRDGDAKLHVTVNRLQWDQRSAIPQTQTIMYAQHQVDLLAAALLMPRNASYAYEVTTGGVELVYAFEIVTNLKGAKTTSKVYRGQVSRDWRTCANARIQNVFGGIQPASFAANDQMKQVCGGNRSVSTPEELRHEVINRLDKEIRAIPAIATAISAG